MSHLNVIITSGKVWIFFEVEASKKVNMNFQGRLLLLIITTILNYKKKNKNKKY